MNEPIGRFGSCRPGARTAYRGRHRANSFGLADTRLAIAVLHRAAFRARLPASCPPAYRSSATRPARHGSGVTASSTTRLPAFSLSSSAFSELFLETRDDPSIGQFARALDTRPCAARWRVRCAPASSSLLTFCRIGRACPSPTATRRQRRALFLELDEFLLQPLQPVLRRANRFPSSAPPARSSAARSRGRSRRALPAWNRPASQPCRRFVDRSIALSGRKRSVM
jgi:hypothetical protein